MYDSLTTRLVRGTLITIVGYRYFRKKDWL